MTASWPDGPAAAKAGSTVRAQLDYIIWITEEVEPIGSHPLPEIEEWRRRVHEAYTAMIDSFTPGHGDPLPPDVPPTIRPGQWPDVPAVAIPGHARSSSVDRAADGRAHLARRCLVPAPSRRRRDVDRARAEGARRPRSRPWPPDARLAQDRAEAGTREGRTPPGSQAGGEARPIHHEEGAPRDEVPAARRLGAQGAGAKEEAGPVVHAPSVPRPA